MSDPSPTLLTIHVCRGKFLVWQPEVCRSLALDWRIVGDFGSLRQRQQSWGGASSSSNTPAATPDGEFSVLSLPMHLMPIQVLFLLHHAPAAKLLRIVDASSIAALRGAAPHAANAADAAASSSVAAPAVLPVSLGQESINQRMAVFKRTVDNQVRAYEAIKQLHGGDSAAPSALASDVNMLTDSSEPIQTDLPSGSSLQVAINAFPCPPDAASTMKTGHPVASLLTLLYPLEAPPMLVSNKLNHLELRTKLTQQHIPAGIADWNHMQRLVYQHVCENVGIPFHSAGCSSQLAAAPAQGATSPAAVFSLFSTFCMLWSRGYVVMPGAHFSTDLVAYEDLPSRVHSSFLIKMMNDQSASAAGFNMLWMSGMGRMATALNKAILLVRTRGDFTHAPNTSITAQSPSCSCVAAFCHQLQQYQCAQLDFTTFHWNLNPSLAHSSFSKSHLNPSAMQFIQ